MISFSPNVKVAFGEKVCSFESETEKENKIKQESEELKEIKLLRKEQKEQTADILKAMSALGEIAYNNYYSLNTSISKDYQTILSVYNKYN